MVLVLLYCWCWNWCWRCCWCCLLVLLALVMLVALVVLVVLLVLLKSWCCWVVGVVGVVGIVGVGGVVGVVCVFGLVLYPQKEPHGVGMPVLLHYLHTWLKNVILLGVKTNQKVEKAKAGPGQTFCHALFLRFACRLHNFETGPCKRPMPPCRKVAQSIFWDPFSLNLASPGQLSIPPDL